MSDTTPRTALEHFNKNAKDYEAGTAGCTREVADHIISLLHNIKPITRDSVILDNACGTGVVTDQLLRSEHIAQHQPEVHAVDAADNMIRITKGRFSSYQHFHSAVMLAEDLSYPDDTFSHSITNLGLMFFGNSEKGAAEIVRTLKPDGVAAVTGWEDLGYLKIIQDVQKQIRPAGELYQVPLHEDWFNPEYTKAILTGAGLGDIEVSTIWVHFGAKTHENVAELLMRSLGQAAFGTWSDDEKSKATALVKERVKMTAVPFSRWDESGVGILMKASVFVGRKFAT